MGKRAVLYTRVSRATEESVSVDRQEAELREMARTEGWDVVAVYQDDGLSGRVERLKANAALDAVADGHADVLAVWEMSRWSRMGLPVVARLVEVLRSRQGTLFVAKKEGLRSDQAAFGIMAAVIAEVAAMEAESTRERIMSARAYILAETDPDEQRWLGGRVPFGYRAVERDGKPGKALVVDEAAAFHVSTAAQMLLDGSTLTQVTRYLTDNAATPQGKGAWRISTVRKLMQSPTLVGRTTRRVVVGTRADGRPIVEDRVVTDAAGLPIRRWEPILDAETYAALQEMFAKRGPNESRKAASWLSGQLFCDLCGSPLYANSRKGRGVDSFRCSNKAYPGSQCPGVSVSRKLAEDYMEAVILGAIGGLPEYKIERRTEGPDESALAEVQLAIADVQAAFARDGADYAALGDRMDALARERRRLLDERGGTVTTSTPTGRTLADAWAEGGVRERRELIDGMLDGIRVRKPAAAGRASRIEDRLEPVWVDPVDEDD
ncbi:recombinase family protein [uncultured Microbacterium sp.]|uniref:recombinase family protein n=1 Tax=uncultured Microbacterium sp. TaxID=191216 RepID=UPI0025CCC544|nr:recombinase family protein [uncultured Microbacterium sp.]